MLSHVTIGTNDIERAKQFYDAVMPIVGVACIADERANGLIGYAKRPDATPQVWIARPIDGKPGTVGNGATLALQAKTRAAVDRFYETAIAAGAKDEGPPGLRAYHPDYYGAYMRDPDGHKICIVCHSGE